MFLCLAQTFVQNLLRFQVALLLRDDEVSKLVGCFNSICSKILYSTKNLGTSDRLCLVLQVTIIKLYNNDLVTDIY